MIDRPVRLRSALALLALLPLLGSCSDSVVPAGPPPHDVVIIPDAAEAGPNAFAPVQPVISLSAQNTVTWYNGDNGAYGGSAGSAHRLKSDDGATFESGTILPGGVFEATFSAPGTYTYHCEFHEEMTGTITVVP